MPFLTAQQVNSPACSPHSPCNAERETGKAANTNFNVIGLIRLGIKLKSTAPEADALTTRPSENSRKIYSKVSNFKNKTKQRLTRKSKLHRVNF